MNSTIGKGMVNEAPSTSSSRPVYQTTLKSPIHCSGVALHSGARVAMTLKPADPESGIRFRRTDIGGRGDIIPARWDRVVDTRLCTMLGNDSGVTVSTVEHLMAALAGSRIDNVDIEINGPEVPIMDGSSAPFLFLIECAGVTRQAAPRRAIRVERAVTAGDNDRFATLSPGNRLSVGFEIDFDSAAVARQELHLDVTPASFKSDLSRARTFGFLHEVEHLRSIGLARGGSLDNAVVVSGDKVLNEGGLRYDDEFVRHKMLDAVGDLYLAGGPLLGHVQGKRCGHQTHNAVLRALFADPANWSSVELTEDTMRAPPRVDLPLAAAS